MSDHDEGAYEGQDNSPDVDMDIDEDRSDALKIQPPQAPAKKKKSKHKHKNKSGKHKDRDGSRKGRTVVVDKEGGDRQQRSTIWDRIGTASRGGRREGRDQRGARDDWHSRGDSGRQTESRDRYERDRDRKSRQTDRRKVEEGRPTSYHRGQEPQLHGEKGGYHSGQEAGRRREKDRRHRSRSLDRYRDRRREGDRRRYEHSAGQEQRSVSGSDRGTEESRRRSPDMEQESGEVEERSGERERQRVEDREDRGGDEEEEEREEGEHEQSEEEEEEMEEQRHEEEEEEEEEGEETKGGQQQAAQDSDDSSDSSQDSSDQSDASARASAEESDAGSGREEQEEEEGEKREEEEERGSRSEGEEREVDPARPYKSKFDDSSESEDERSGGSSSHQHHPSDDNYDLELASSPEPSPPQPVPAPLPVYFPAIQGCRSVEEFHCLNRIEEGTYGVVYRAKDKRKDETVALKRLKMEKEKEGFPITSLREINTLLKAQHVNIVTVREIVVGSNMDKIYIVMDFVEHDLKSLMLTMEDKGQPFLPGEIKCLLQQLLRGVNHLHDNWIIHRDLKTSNLLLSHAGILKIGDFGLAREYGSPLRQYTPIVVTLWYRSPELLLGCKKYSTAVDLWSVGCIFAEFYLMKALWQGKSEIEELQKIFKDLGTPSEKIWPGVSELPGMKKCTFADHPYNTLRNKFGSRLTDNAFGLMNKLFTYNPLKRISADQALIHEYFKETPRPIDPSDFPTWPARSELPKHKKQETPKPPSGGKAYAKLLGDDDGFQFTAAKGAVTGFSLKF